jgi:hypothetical protein
VFAVLSVALGEAPSRNRRPCAGTACRGRIGEVGVGDKGLSVAIVIVVDTDQVFISPWIHETAGLNRRTICGRCVLSGESAFWFRWVFNIGSLKKHNLSRIQDVICVPVTVRERTGTLKMKALS